MRDKDRYKEEYRDNTKNEEKKNLKTLIPQQAHNKIKPASRRAPKTHHNIIQKYADAFVVLYLLKLIGRVMMLHVPPKRIQNENLPCNCFKNNSSFFTVWLASNTCAVGAKNTSDERRNERLRYKKTRVHACIQ